MRRAGGTIPGGATTAAAAAVLALMVGACAAAKDCPVGKFACQLNSRSRLELCVPNSWMCDGTKDCADNYDEYKCPFQPCSSSEFACVLAPYFSNAGAKFCAPTTWKCDGTKDCADGSDEHRCRSSRSCRAGRFRCTLKSSGISYCAPNKWKCDGEVDCRGGGDEVGCSRGRQSRRTTLAESQAILAILLAAASGKK